GFVVPAVEGRALLACTYASRKFPHRAPDGHELLRAFVGGALRPDLPALADDPLVATVRSELRALLGIAATPLLTRVHRYPRAMPTAGSSMPPRTAGSRSWCRSCPAGPSSRPRSR